LQQGVDFEVLVVNDGSDDGTFEFLENSKLKYQNLKIIHHHQSLGIIRSRQEAVKESNGLFLAFLDDDDEWILPTKLLQQVTMFESDPSLVLCGAGMEMVNADGVVISRKIYLGTDQEIRRSMLLKNQFFTSTVMVRKKSLESVGGFVSDGTDLAEDYDLWLRLGLVGKFALLPKVVTRYKVPTYSKEKKLNFFRKQWKLIKREKGNYPNGYLAEFYMILRVIRIYVVFWS
jgi:glycosyltransferase involved in cell wall biosynthesis